MSKLKFFQDRKKEWRWTLYARNGKKIATSGEGYKRASAALRVWTLISGQRILFAHEVEGLPQPKKRTKQ